MSLLHFARAIWMLASNGCVFSFLCTRDDEDTMDVKAGLC
jgi:hypothetical protein